MYATGQMLDENNKTWMENDQYTYSINGTKIIIDGKDVFTRIFHLEFNIVLLGQSTMVNTVPVFMVKRISYPDTSTYTVTRITEDYSTKFTGVWYGKCTSVAPQDTAFHYWQYFPDGCFNYYYRDETGSWIKKADNEGHYFLYGNLLATNFTNDLITGGTGKSYECWNFYIDGTKMTWTGLRPENTTITYAIDKVAVPPVVR